MAGPGSQGACATSHPEAVRAGIELLKKGGSAVDAAVGMAAALTVVEPTSNGIGSDAFALVWAGDEFHGLNGSGCSPAGTTLENLQATGEKRMPRDGWWPVTVPGAPAAWRDLHERFGKLEFAEVLQPAIDLATEGYRVTPVVAKYWRLGVERFGKLEEPQFREWSRVFAPSGSAPREGDLVTLPDHASTLSRIARSQARDFYEGELAETIDEFSRETGGFLRGEDLAAHAGAWVTPLSARYRNAEVLELPPNGQGIVALSALRMLELITPGETPTDPEGVHAGLEAIKLAFADAEAHVTDLRHMDQDPIALLDRKYCTSRRRMIGAKAELRETGLPRKGGTVYLCAADGDGMMVSFIQSNYMGFGSGIVVPGTGIALQNRGVGFNLESDHPNVLGPGKRPFHTIIPGFLARDGKPWGPFGVMGGHMQPQGHVQVVRALVDFGLSPQAALDLPRWHWSKGLDVHLEPGFPDESGYSLELRGHNIKHAPDESLFGRGQIILKNRDGSFMTGSDWRADGDAQVF